MESSKMALAQVMVGLMAGQVQAHRCEICSLRAFSVLLAMVGRVLISFSFCMYERGFITVGCFGSTLGISSMAFKRNVKCRVLGLRSG